MSVAGSVKRNVMKRPAVIGFLILFAFSFYGLRKDSQTSEANKRIASAQTTLARNQAKLAQKESYDNCVAINEGRRSARAAAERLAQVSIKQAVGLRDRFVQANGLNPPSDAQELASYAAGLRFFNDLIHDTTTLANSAVAELQPETLVLPCSKTK